MLWHDGYAVDVEEIAEHPEYRGATVVDLAREIARGRRLMPAVLGLARSASFDPQDVKKGLALHRSIRRQGVELGIRVSLPVDDRRFRDRTSVRRAR